MTVPTLLIPGLNCSPLLFADQLALLWQFGPVMVCDHRCSDTIAGIAGDVLAHAPPRFALGGLSLGGVVALEIMRRAPQRVTHLALLSCSARAEIAGGPADLIREERMQMARDGRCSELPPLHYARNVHPDRQTDDALRETHRRMTEQVGSAGYLNQQEAMRNRPDSRSSLAAIRCPTLVLVGDADVIAPQDHAEEMAAGIAGSTLAIVARCGHLSTLEQPQAVNAALQRWRQAAASSNN